MLAYTDPSRGGLAGLAFGNALKQLGFTEDLKPKTKLIPGLGHDVVAAVERGEATLGAAPTNDVTPPSPGIAIIGPLPKELKSDVLISAGLLANAPDKVAAETLIKFLTSQAAAPAIVAGGLEP
jgi:molybdate transport system substrate-binding protein